MQLYGNKIPFEKYPDHVRVLKGYCWKPIIVKVISKMSFRCLGIPLVFLSIILQKEMEARLLSGLSAGLLI